MGDTSFGQPPFDRPLIGEVRAQQDPQAVGVIHDLGNLVQVAASAVNLMARSPGDSRAAELAPLISGARSALDRAGVLVRQTIGAAQTGASVLENVNVTACLAETGDLIQHMLSSDIRLHVRTSSDALAVTVNRLALQNAILNLVFNARDAMPDGGVISIAACEARNGLKGPEVEIRVADTGMGMSSDVIARVFEPYFTTRDGGVGGVGLPMVKRFAEAAGGGIGITSAPGAGTTVTIRLPAAGAI